MAKTRKKEKEPIRLRFKELADGNRSIYLDTYRNGKRKWSNSHFAGCDTV